MTEINTNEVENVSGGIAPLLVIAAKGFGAGFGTGAAAFTLYFTISSQH